MIRSMPATIEVSSVTSISNVVTPALSSAFMRSTRRATAYVVKPASRSISAVCSPIPLEPPVTSATRVVMTPSWVQEGRHGRAGLAGELADVEGLDGSGALLTIAEARLTVRLTRDLWLLDQQQVELA